MDLQINGQMVAGDVQVREVPGGQHQIVGRFGIALMSSLGDFIDAKLNAQGDDQLVDVEGKVEYQDSLYEFACKVRFGDVRITEVMYVDFASAGEPTKWQKVQQ